MGLAWLIREHGEALEADFERYYSIDLVDLYRGHLTPRKAQTLAIRLPPGALTWQDVGTDAAWSTESHLLAQIVDTLNAANYQRAGGKGDKPKPLPRPTDLKEIQDKRERMLQRASKFKARQSRKP